MPLDDKDRYAACVQLLANTENVTWNRFYNYLVFTTLMLLTWAQLQSNANKTEIKIVCCVLCLVGLFSSLAWTFLGVRGRGYVKLFADLGKKIEVRNQSSDTSGPSINPCESAEIMRDAPSVSKFFASFYIQLVTPIVFGAFYILLFIITLVQK